MAVAWPYANGPLHLGHIAGAYLPADVFARYHRMIGSRVLMISGSDFHGTPITVRADNEGRTPQDVVDQFHPEFQRYWRELGISFDLFTSTGTPNHQDVVHDFFNRLYAQGHIYKATMQQFFDPQAGRFLPDRYVEGTCPNCGYEKARGDQCDNCGRTLDPEQLINPRSRLTGAVPQMRDTDHFFFKLSAFQQPLLEWLTSREGWRKHVQNSSIGWIEEGLHDRAITRDLEWGVTLPNEDLGPGKRIYVWFEAFIGYVSAAVEWAHEQGAPAAWEAWWKDPRAETYYFIGKDNIFYHTIFWPAVLMAYGGPNNLAEVEPYLADIRGGRPTSHELLEEITDRYRQIGGSSPILALTNAQAAAVERALNDAAAADAGVVAHLYVSLCLDDLQFAQDRVRGDLGATVALSARGAMGQLCRSVVIRRLWPLFQEQHFGDGPGLGRADD